MTALQVAEMLHARPSGRGRWLARCPAHNDRHPSLTITQGRDATLLRCWSAGCTVEQIVAAVGLQMRDLFHCDQSTPQERRKAADAKACQDAGGAHQRMADREKRERVFRLGRIVECNWREASTLTSPPGDGKAIPRGLRKMAGGGDKDVSNRARTWWAANARTAVLHYYLPIALLSRLRLCILCSCTPDLNPIEKAWAKLKQMLRSAKARNKEALDLAITQALPSSPPTMPKPGSEYGLAHYSKEAFALAVGEGMQVERQLEELLLDSSFWQSLGIALGWKYKDGRDVVKY